MMSVLEYAEDINRPASYVLSKCKELGINVNSEEDLLDEENINDIFNRKIDFVIDAIDTVSGKIALIEEAQKAHTPIISCMGAGNKLDPTSFEVTDIYKTSVCPLAKVMRHELKKRGIKKCKVLYSKEVPLKPKDSQEETSRRSLPGSIAFVPSAAGLIIGGEVIKDLVKDCRK